MLSRRCARFLLALVLAAAPRAATAASAESPDDPRDPGLAPLARLEALVERVRERQHRLDTLEAEFVEVKQSQLLLAPLEARGVFSYKAPDRVRWEYLEPDPVTLIIDGDRLTTWYRDLGRAEQADIGRRSERVLEYLGAGSSLATLLQYFSVSMAVAETTDAPYRLELEPLFDRVAARIRSMSIWIDSATYLPTYLRYVEPDGDSTEYRFAAARVDEELPAERFELELPAGVVLREIDLGRHGAAR